MKMLPSVLAMRVDPSRYLIRADNQNVSKGAISGCIKNGIIELGQVKSKTKAGSGCGGCVPMVTSIFNAEMKKAGHTLTNQCVLDPPHVV